jgi:hypothetical protein
MDRVSAGRRRNGIRLALAAGILMTAAGIVLALLPPPAVPDVGALPSATGDPAGLAPIGPGAAAPAGGLGWSTVPDGTAVPPVPFGGSPSQVRIADLALAADVDPVGVDRSGRLDIPADPRRLGWWIGAARPGDDVGTVLVAGHVDTADSGRGALFRLETLPVGAAVEVTGGGQVFHYRVTARRSYVKTRLPADLFAAGGPPRLVLVTCGGGFHDGSYDHNVVVYAAPV